ncbi:TetR/AcrR family transcriptional regulator [Roseobacter sp. GAI101]|uniref:TetR/AcrR family transcriptional regulator n=1 Tax=Roseobacter sp. (strain GAI101) TaxID=391589 RepID=UPI0001871FDB|nr:TetR/AcrR family transcriptional regulator [Roseobacter sp. GAI101]EEB84760.1 transcriptional regulator, TetR family [Roseobacter sp. GAI101]
MTNGPDHVRRGRKFGQVLAGAREVFLADGFEGASVDDIARVAGVSKATLYSYFPDKRILFIEVADHECARQAQEALDHIDTDAAPAEVLGQAGRHILRFLTSTLGQQMFRLFVAESDRFPQLGQRFYNSGPAVLRKEMVTYFKAAIARGELNIEDLVLAADQFGELCKADLWPRLMFGVVRSVSDAEIDRVVDGAVEMFMARYGV